MMSITTSGQSNHTEGRSIPYTLQWAAPSLQTAPSHGDVDPIYRGTLDPLESTPQMASRSVQPFLQDSPS